MTQITASLVKELRDATGAGMMDCKKALTETAGDLEAAMDWLRIKGLSKASKKSDRVAAEGLVALAASDHRAVAIEVNSETDFVANNVDFQALVSSIVRVALDKNVKSIEELQDSQLEGGDKVKDALINAIAKIGENMNLRRVARIEITKGAIGQYVHNQVLPGLGKIAVLVGLESEGKADVLAEFSRMLAMHIAASKPDAVTIEELAPEVIEREKTVQLEKHKDSGKPAHIIEKIVESSIKAFCKDVCLVDQVFVHDTSKTVGQMIKETESKCGAKIEIKGFVRMALGEGVEKAESDFAAEVAATAGV